MNPSLSEFRLNINFSKTKPFQEPNPSDLPFPNFFLYFQKLSFIHSCLPTNLKESDPLISSENDSHSTVHWCKPKKSYSIYSCDHKFVVFCFALLLPQILDKFQNQCQFWNLLVLTVSKHPLQVQFNQVLAEIMEVKDTWYHSFVFMSFDLLEMKRTEIWTICSKNCSVHHQWYQYQQE